MLTRLVEFAPAHGELAEAVEDALRGRITDSSSDIGAALATFAMGFEVAHRREPMDNAERELARLGRVDIVELHDLEVGEFDKGSRVGFAQVRVFADVHMTVLA